MARALTEPQSVEWPRWLPRAQASTPVVLHAGACRRATRGSGCTRSATGIGPASLVWFPFAVSCREGANRALWGPERLTGA